MKKVLFQASTVAATCALALALASCSMGGASVKSYKNEVSSEQFSSDLLKAAETYTEEITAIMDKWENKSFKGEFSDLYSVKYSGDEYKEKGYKGTESLKESYQYNAEKNACSCKGTSKKSYSTLTNKKEETNEEDYTLFATGKEVTFLDNKYKEYYTTECLSQELATSAVKSKASQTKYVFGVVEGIFDSALDTSLFATDEIKYYVDETQFTVAVSTTFEKKENITGKAKFEYQIRFEGTTISIVSKKTEDYTKRIEAYIKGDVESTITVKGESSSSLESIVKEKTISINCTDNSNYTSTTTKSGETILDNRESENTSKMTLKQATPSIKTSTDGYTVSKTPLF